MICADPRSVPAWKGKIKPLGNTRSTLLGNIKTCLAVFIFIGQWQHVLPSSHVFPMLMPLEWHQFHVTCSKGMNIVWGYCGFMAQYSTALLLQPLLSALLPGSCPTDLTIRIWPINVSQFHSNLIRTLSRCLTRRRHNIAKAVGRKMTSCCISGGRCISVFTSQRPAQAKAAESRWEAWSKFLTNAMLMNCISNNVITVPQSSPWRSPWFLLPKKTMEKTSQFSEFFRTVLHCQWPSWSQTKASHWSSYGTSELSRFKGNIPSPGET